MTTIRKVSAVDEVFNLIQDKIHNGEFPIGYAFPPQKRMAEEYGVSVSTIREAIGKLTMLGYLSAKQGVGTRVENNVATGGVTTYGQYVFLTSNDVIHFIEARLCLEKSAIRLAAYKAEDSHYTKLNAIIKQQKIAVKTGNEALFSSADKDFHKSLMTIGQNPILLQLMEVIQDGLDGFIEEITRLETVKQSAIRYHEGILACVRKRDVLAAERMLVEHLWDAIKLTGAALHSSAELEELFEREAKLYSSLGQTVEHSKV